MTQDSWQARLTRDVIAEIQRLRKERGWSAQRLADECSELGLDMSRSTIADLENGRRLHFGIPELVVFAAALDVPPLLLIYPVGHQAEAEVWPGEVRPAFRAALWFTGEAPSPSRADDDGGEYIAEADENGPGRALVLYRKHDQAARAEIQALRDAEAMPQYAVLYSQLAELQRQTAAEIRQELAAEGIRVPAPIAGLITETKDEE